LTTLRSQQAAEREIEAKAFRLAARGNVSGDVFDQEVGLIRTRQRWITEQLERISGQLEDLRRNNFDPQTVEFLRQRLETRLASATPQDRRFILDAIGAKVLVQADGTWELEVQAPTEVATPSTDLQVVNSRPGSNST